MTISRLKEKAQANKVATAILLGILSIISFTMGWKTLHQDDWHFEITVKPGDEFRLSQAVHHYRQDHREEVNHTPQVISPTKLAKSGYLDAETAKRWESIQLKIHLPQPVKGGGLPSDVIIEAAMLTDDTIVLLADGSVQSRTP